MAILTREELQFLLHRCWEIEKKFEWLSAWQSFVSVASDYRMTILTLAGDSHKQRLNLEELFQKLGLEVPTDEIPEVTFDFEGLLDSEILHKTIEQDEIARDLYAKIVEY